MGFGILASIRRVLTGEVIQKTDVAISNGAMTVSLRLKKSSGDLYVVMACTTTGNYQYYAMDLDEFQAVTDAMLATGTAIDRFKTPAKPAAKPV